MCSYLAYTHTHTCNIFFKSAKQKKLNTKKKHGSFLAAFERQLALINPMKTKSDLRRGEENFGEKSDRFRRGKRVRVGAGVAGITRGCRLTYDTDGEKISGKRAQG